MKKLSDKQIFTLLFLASFILRIIFLSDCLFHHDSVQLANAVRKTVETGKIQPAVSGRYGFVLINTIAFLLLKNFTNNIDFILNITTAFFASLSIPFIFLFALKLTKNKRASLITALLFSITPIFLSATVYAKSHGMAFFFAILSGLMLLSYIENNKLTNKVLFVLFFSISITIRSTNIFYLLPFISMTILNKKRIKQNLFPIGLSLIIYFIIGFSTLSYETSVNPIFSDIVQLLKLIIFNLTNLYLTLTFLGIILAIIGIYILIKEKKQKLLIICLIWFIPYYLAISIIPTTTARFLIPILFPLILFISIAMDFIFKIKKSAGIIVLIAISLFMLINIIPVIHFRSSYCAPKEFALYTKNITKENAVIITNDDSVFFQYYANLNTAGYPLTDNKTILSKAILSYVDILEAGKPLYVTGKILFLSTESNSSYKTLNHNFILIKKGEALNEEYHHAELFLRKRNEAIYEIRLNQTKKRSDMRVYYETTS